MNCENEPLLEIKDLKIGFKTPEGLLHAVKGISLEVKREKSLG